MRALARRLQVAPNALYSHVPNKAALLDEVLDDLLAAVAAPDPAGIDPVAGLTAVMSSSYAVLTAHADLVPAYLLRQGARGANATRLGDVMTVLLERAGITGPAALEARRVLIVHTIGFAAFATAAPDAERPLPPDETAAMFANSLRWLLAGITGRADRT
jgi:AcrR family transcriptional regulator